VINLTKLDRGSPERAKAVKAFEKKYGKQIPVPGKSR
jgi:hypothetical protein